MRGLIIALALVPATARADEWRGLELGGSAGVGTPLGTVGIELEAIVYRTLAIAGGVGLGPGGSAAALQPRLFQHDDASGFYGGLGASVSGEHFVACEGDCIIDPMESGTAYWANVEAGYEKHYGGAYVRGFVGFSLMLDKGSVCIAGGQCDDKVPYLGVAIGAVIGSASPSPVEQERAQTPTAAAPGATPSNDPRLPELTDEARTAATRWRCDLARSIGAKVEAIDRAYHDQIFVQDSAIAACLE